LYVGVIYLKLEWRLTFISKLVLFFLRPKWKLALLKRWAWFIWNLNKDLYFLHLFQRWFWFFLDLNESLHYLKGGFGLCQISLKAWICTSCGFGSFFRLKWKGAFTIGVPQQKPWHPFVLCLES
jgi:hypothetical protein